MNLTFKESKILMENGVWLCLKVNEPAPAREFVLTKKEKLYDCQLKEHRDKRSLDANKYAWALLSQLADVLNTTKEELYLHKVRDIGPFKDFTLTQDEAKTFRVAWEMLGTGWPTEQVDFDQDGDRVVIRAYYGSSTYNTKRMSRLIDSIVEDCKAVGVETLPPDKIQAMKEEWGRASAN
jgi:hypothetical protein